VPTYEYACTACDATHEVQQKMSDPTLTECPVCGSPGVRKLFTGVGIHFKGSGFYRTDSRDAKSPSSTATGSSGSTSGGDSKGGSTAGSGSSDTASSSSSSGSSTSGSSASSAPSKAPATSTT
jgi:putative FmdB family regulatory protein